MALYYHKKFRKEDKTKEKQTQSDTLSLLPLSYVWVMCVRQHQGRLSWQLCLHATRPACNRMPSVGCGAWEQRVELTKKAPNVNRLQYRSENTFICIVLMCVCVCTCKSALNLCQCCRVLLSYLRVYQHKAPGRGSCHNKALTNTHTYKLILYGKHTKKDIPGAIYIFLLLYSFFFFFFLYLLYHTKATSCWPINY